MLFKSQGQLALPSNCPNSRPDLGVIVTENLKVSEQCAKVTMTANKVLGIIKRSYDDKSIANLLPLYKVLVRPHIEYCVQAWRPYYQKDVENELF